MRVLLKEKRPTKNIMLPKTLTEAQAAGGIVQVCHEITASHLSNSGSVPYSEFYRQHTAIIETPIERIQRAGEDEARRLEQRRSSRQ